MPASAIQEFEEFVLQEKIIPAHEITHIRPVVNPENRMRRSEAAMMAIGGIGVAGGMGYVLGWPIGLLVAAAFFTKILLATNWKGRPQEQADELNDLP